MLRLVSTLAAAASLSWAASFSIDQVLSAPFPSGLTASPIGNKIAWVFETRGVRNIWVAEGPDFKAHPLTAYAADDGQEIGNLAWSADAGSIAYTRGGEANGKGEFPNPLSNPAGVRQSVFVVALSGGEPRLVGDGDSPAISPDGKIIVYLNHGQIWSAPTDGSKPAQQLIHARGTAEDLRWSPNGLAFAFTSARGDHSFIGVYSIATKELRFLDPSVDRDSDAAWSPDGARITFVRIPAARTFYDHAARRTAADPWSVRVADVKTGAGREAFKAEPGVGSAFHNMVAANQLFWAAGDRIVFPWERDGWLHLYSVDPGGGATALPNAGRFRDRGRSPQLRTGPAWCIRPTRPDIDRRHLWR